MKLDKRRIASYYKPENLRPSEVTKRATCLKNQFDHKFPIPAKGIDLDLYETVVQKGLGNVLHDIGSDKKFLAGGIKNTVIALTKDLNTNNGHFYEFWYAYLSRKDESTVVIMEGLDHSVAAKLMRQYYNPIKHRLTGEATGADVTVLNLNSDHCVCGGDSVQMKYLSTHNPKGASESALKALRQLYGHFERPFPLTEKVIYLKFSNETSPKTIAKFAEIIRAQMNDSSFAGDRTKPGLDAIFLKAETDQKTHTFIITKEEVYSEETQMQALNKAQARAGRRPTYVAQNPYQLFWPRQKPQINPNWKYPRPVYPTLKPLQPNPHRNH